jgi:dTMP kinase
LGKQLKVVLQEKPMPIDPKAEFLLFAADRAQHFAQIVLPALSDNQMVISDRMADSSLVYQGYARGLDKTMIQTINRWAMADRQPDLVIYVRVSKDIARERLVKRAEKLSSFEKEDKDFTDKLIAGFDDIFKDRKDVIIVDGSLDPETLASQTTIRLLEWMNAAQLWK